MVLLANGIQPRDVRHPAYLNSTVTMRPITKVRILGVRLGVAVLALYWVVIFTGTHLPEVPQILTSYSDKIKHFSAFFGLAMLLCYVTNGDNPYRRFGIIFALASAYGAIDEWTQSLVPGRTTDYWDWGADTLGAATAIGIYVGLRFLFKKSGIFGGYAV